jgi:hypothetical protein
MPGLCSQQVQSLGRPAREPSTAVTAAPASTSFYPLAALPRSLLRQLVDELAADLLKVAPYGITFASFLPQPNGKQTLF